MKKKSKKVTNLSLCLIIILLCSSCVSTALRVMGIHKENVNLKFMNSSTKKVVFIPMHHIGKKEFYNDVYAKTDSLGKIGYKSYYEGIKPDEIDSTKLDTYKRKFRKINGMYIGKKGYIDSTSNKFMGKYKLNKEIINQPKPDVLISKKSNPIKVDIPMNTLVYEFEKEFGEVILDSCDYNIALDSVYKDCKSLLEKDKEKAKKFKTEYVLNVRNKHLANYIQNSKDTKIMVIYGRIHYNGLLEELKKIDNNWK